MRWMAGRSLRFGGEICLNGGGFASVRTHIGAPLDSRSGRSTPATLGLLCDGSDGGNGSSESDATAGVRLEFTGDGQMYKIGLRRSDGFREPTWQAQFATAPAGQRRPERP